MSTVTGTAVGGAARGADAGGVRVCWAVSGAALNGRAGVSGADAGEEAVLEIDAREAGPGEAGPHVTATVRARCGSREIAIPGGVRSVRVEVDGPLRHWRVAAGGFVVLDTTLDARGRVLYARTELLRLLGVAGGRYEPVGSGRGRG